MPSTPKPDGKGPPAGQAWLVPAFWKVFRSATFGPDVLAGLTLAAVAIPECMGYTKIAGTPVVTGLYTILLPILAFAVLGSSRHLVVGADSATAAILFSGLQNLAQPFSAHWLALASTSALLTAGFLFLAGSLRLGFLADFLSRTVLVGFLSGVGVSLLFGQLPDMLGVALSGHGLIEHLSQIIKATPHLQWRTLGMALGVAAVILGCDRYTPRVPGALLAVALAIAGTWIFKLEAHGIATVGRVQAGWPAVGLPRVSLSEAEGLLATSASMFLVIVAQSAATARSFAQQNREELDENRDLLALGAANVLAGLSQTFVVNGSPTKTAVVVAAGGRTQTSQVTTAAVTLAVLLFATALIERLPNAALAAIVFLIGIRLIDVRALRQIARFRKATFGVALATLLGVVFLGVERGIFVAIGLSILDHLRQEYHPKDVVLAPSGEHWKAHPANAGMESEPGLIVYRFESALFFANADYFAARLHQLIDRAPHPVRWLILDLVSMDDIDYTGGLMLSTTLQAIRSQGLTIGLAQIEDVADELTRLGIIASIGEELVFDSIAAAMAAYLRERGESIRRPSGTGDGE
jgi:SulP family sulfate permease